jgi:hypothetical protein
MTHRIGTVATAVRHLEDGGVTRLRVQAVPRDGRQDRRRGRTTTISAISAPKAARLWYGDPRGGGGVELEKRRSAATAVWVAAASVVCGSAGLE